MVHIRRAALVALLGAFTFEAGACSLFVSLDDLSGGTDVDAAEPDAGLEGGGDALGSDVNTPVDAIAEAAPTDAGVDAHVGAVPLFRAFSSMTNGSGNSMIVTRSALIQPGDLMIAFVYEFVYGTTSTPPAGWTFIGGFDDMGPSYEVFYYYKVATSSEPTSYTFVINTADYGEVDLITYSGVDPMSPIDQFSSLIYENKTDFGLAQVTPTSVNDVIFYGAIADGQPSATWSPPSGIATHKTSGYSFFGDQAHSTGISRGDNLVCSVSANGGVAAIALRPK